MDAVMEMRTEKFTEDKETIRKDSAPSPSSLLGVDDFSKERISAQDADSAFENVDDYLRACRLSSKLARANLAAHFVRNAIQKKSAGSDKSLEELSISEAKSYLGSWLAELTDGKAQNGARLHEALLSIYLNDIPSRWPDVFLSNCRAPDELRKSVHKSSISSAPNLEFTSMVPEKIDMGMIHEIADSTMDILNKRPILKMLVGWILFIALMIFLFWYTRGRVL